MADQQRGDFPPTDQAEAFRLDVEAELDRELERLDTLLATQLPKINELAQKNGVRILDSRGRGSANP